MVMIDIFMTFSNFYNKYSFFKEIFIVFNFFSDYCIILNKNSLNNIKINMKIFVFLFI